MSDRNVTPNTAVSSQDRLTEIRARLDAATPEWNYDNDQSGADVDLINHAPADIAWLLAGYALAVDTIWAGYEAINGRRMPPAERAEMLAAWGVSEDDIAWAKQQEDPRNGK